jgi:membrane associated rhomboid family serine protease
MRDEPESSEERRRRAERWPDDWDVAPDYGDLASDSIEESAPEPGLLAQKPQPGSLNAPVMIAALCGLASTLYWWHPQGAQLAGVRQENFIQGLDWRLLTSVFVHSDMAHLFSNLGLLLLFGWLLRAFIGRLAFPWLALVAGVITQFLSLWTYDPGVRLVGASGMVYAMGGMWLAYYWALDKTRGFAGRFFRVLGFILVVFMPSQLQPRVSYRAHAIGLGVGMVLALVTLPHITRLLQARRDKRDSAASGTFAQ